MFVKIPHLTVVCAAAALAGAAATATAGPAAAAAMPAPTGSSGSAAIRATSVNVENTGKYDVLVNAAGSPLYMLTGNSTSHPMCTSKGCLASWPAATAKTRTPTLAAGIPGKLTTWKHGKVEQLVLNGHPLYTYVGDSGTGTASGQGLMMSGGGTWELLTAGGSAFTNTAASNPDPYKAPSSGGGGKRGH